MIHATRRTTKSTTDTQVKADDGFVPFEPTTVQRLKFRLNSFWFSPLPTINLARLWASLPETAAPLPQISIHHRLPIRRSQLNLDIIRVAESQNVDLEGSQIDDLTVGDIVFV